MTALLRAVRRQRGLTLDNLAEQTGLTKSYLSNIERGQSTLSIALALKVARALVFVPAGTVELDCGEQTITLGTGDSAYFDASLPHPIRGIGKPRAEVVVVACR